MDISWRANIDSRLTLRWATIEDAEMIFAWRNLPEIIALGTTQKPVEWEEHRVWFQQTINSRNHLLLIILLDEKPIGQVRFDQSGNQVCQVSIYLMPQYTGRGLGVIALRDACMEAFAQMPVNEIVALIRKDNQRSVSAFQKAGFKFADHTTMNAPAGHFVLRMERPADVPHNRVTHGVSETEAIRHTVESGYWANGPRVAELEVALAQAAGVKHAVCVASGLSALRLALKGLGIKSGNKVLVPAYSCVALANAILACGALPLPVDVTPDDWNFSIAEGKRMLATVQPQAVIAVHTFGDPAPIEDMLSWGIPIIEDCAHAFGIQVNGRPLGGRAHAAILSFYATKLIGAGEGGAVLTNSDELARFVKSWRDYGDQPPDGTRLNDKMTDLEATLALCQLNRLQDMIAARQRLAEQYHELLSPEANQIGAIRLPDISRPRVWYRYTVEMLRVLAREVVEHLKRYGVHAAQPVTDWRSRDSDSCPVADQAYRQVVSLPLYPTLTSEEQERVVYAFAKIGRAYA